MAVATEPRYVRSASLSWPYPVRVGDVPMLAFRVLVVACQAATFWVTWPLWQVHAQPPMLPLLPFPAVDLGLPLLASLLVVLVAPLPGLAIHSVLLLYAMLIDQTRIQPEVVSLAFLMWGTLPNPTALAFARVHLVSMWLFAGINKLLSPGFMVGTAQWMVDGMPFAVPTWVYENAGYLIAGTELSIGVLAIVPRTRKVAAVLAFGLHAGILLDLSPLGHDWNVSVWPWNAALAFAGFALIWPWQGSLFHCVMGCHRVARPLVLLVLAAPIGFYFGLTDAYLSHNLYSSNTASARVDCAGGCQPFQDPDITWNAFNVPLPPEHRLYQQYFQLTCEPGDRMVITDSRWWFRDRGSDKVRIDCAATP